MICTTEQDALHRQWQELLLYDILAENDDGLWVHTKFGYSVPRRNGKNEIVAIRELYGLFHGERILHTAHRTTTSGAAWKRLCDLLIKLDVKEEKYTVSNGFKTGKSKGQEFIELCDELGGGRVDFRTRTTTGGLGEGFDLLIIDEAQEYQTDQESALKYVVSRLAKSADALLWDAADSCVIRYSICGFAEKHPDGQDNQCRMGRMVRRSRVRSGRSGIVV